AKKALKDAGVKTPVTLNLQYNPDHYGPSSGDEYALVKDQLDKTGLFKVNLQSTEWVQYSKDRTDDAYPMYQLGWFPDYSDADNYLVPFFYDTDETPSFLANHYRDKTMNKELNAQSSIDDKGKRADALKKIQGQLAEELPTLPLLQGNQIAVSGKDVKGVDDTLDPAFQFRLALLSK
ncbi:MAG: ABC transporter substrate-binding protein, partial [Brevibacterium aurantiacum]